MKFNWDQAGMPATLVNRLGRRELSDEEVTRLGKLAPKSIAKLKNTLSTQFRVADVSETVAALEAKGVIKLDGNHVSWTVD